MKARVLIALGSEILGGPGKGLLQFLRSGGLAGCSPLLAAYNKPEQADTEYIKAMRLSGAPLAVLLQNSPIDLGLLEQGLKLTRENGTQILQSHGYKSHVLCWLLHRKTGLPWVAFVHGWTTENIKVRLYNALEHIMLLFADEVVAVSEALRERLLPPVRGRCRVIPNAVDPDEMLDKTPERSIRAELGIKESDLVAGVSGRLSPEKGQLVFLKALAAARRLRPELKGLLVGGGPEEEQLRKQARVLGLEGHCFFTGHVQGMPSYYRAMDIQIMPSFREGMPNAALEGMLHGLPLIASKVGGVPEVVLDGVTGLLIPAGDGQALTTALLRLSADAPLRTALGEAGRKRVLEHFVPAARSRRILNLYEQMLNRSDQNEPLE